jgi:hypothetical protein
MRVLKRDRDLVHVGQRSVIAIPFLQRSFMPSREIAAAIRTSTLGAGLALAFSG